MMTEKEYNIIKKFWNDIMHEVVADVVADDVLCVVEHPLYEIMELANSLLCEHEDDN